MGKKNTKKNEKNIKKGIEKKEFAGEAKNLLVITVLVLLFLGLFYLLTVVILDDNTDNDNSDEIEEVEIQFDEILVGTSFSLRDEEYYVLYYETEDEDVGSDLSSMVYTYRSSNAEPYLYTVDMSNALNASFTSEESNSEAKKASDLKIAGPTLIKFVDGEIDEYIEGIDDITDTLE